MKHIDTVIVGGGQAGLVTSYFLTRKKHEHIVLERSAHAAGSWRDLCWDSFTLVTPNWAFKIPGAELKNTVRDAFMPRRSVIDFFENYITRFELPLKYRTNVESIEKSPEGFIVRTNEGSYQSKNVIIATGFFQRPKIPAYAKNFSPDITQLHSSEYRSPGLIRDGAILVVGSGQSGSQIAEELYHAGRKVFLSVGRAGRAPRRYRGKDIIEWLSIAGFFDLTPEQLPPGMGKFDGIPHLSGTKGGHTINLHQFARDGVTLLGHVKNVIDDTISIEADLHDNLKIVDEFEQDVTKMIDEFIRENELDSPAEELIMLHEGYDQPVIEELSLKKETINTVIWATGYNFDYSLVKLPVLDSDGFPIQSKGVTNYPGLYFAGIPWMPSEKSGFLLGVGESARHIADCVLERKVDG